MVPSRNVILHYPIAPTNKLSSHTILLLADVVLLLYNPPLLAFMLD